jgi:16S rRNA processing protein RimM
VSREPSRIEIGGIARAHGIRGEVVIVTHDPDSATLGDVETIWVGGVEQRVLAVRDTQRGWLVQLEGITTRNDAERLRGKPVEVDRAAIALEEGDVLLADLVGCAVRLLDGRPWGTIAEIMIGAQELLVIHDGAIERLLPLVDAFVKDIDLEARVVTVDPPDGLPESPLVGKHSTDP